MTYEFEVPGKITGKGRPRVNSYTGIVYTPTKTKDYETLVEQYFLLKYPRFKEIVGRAKVTITAYFEVPKSTKKSDKENMLNNKISPTKKPDIDNIVKIVLDAMNKFAFKDDTQITKLEVEKIYGIEEKLTGYQMLMQFCEKNGRLPKQIAGKKATLTEKQIYERNLYAKWKTSKEKQLVDKYVGIPVEEIPEEDRAIVEQVRSYGYLGNAKKSANSLGKAVGKAVTVTEIQQANEFLNTITQDKEKREEQE